MLLSDIFAALTYGEFSQLKFAGAEDGDGITIAEYPRVLPALNAALTELYIRFPLRTKEIFVAQEESISIYTISKNFAVNGGSAEPIKYIVDTVADPFIDSVLHKIESVVDEEGCPLPLNDPLNEDSLNTPEYNTLQIPKPVTGQTTGVIYRAGHDPILLAGLDPAIKNINIPPALITPLLYFIASRVMISMTKLDGQNSSMDFLVLFENAIQNANRLGLVNHDSALNRKLENNGWA